MPQLIPSYRFGTLTINNLDNPHTIERMNKLIASSQSSGQLNGLSFIPSPKEHVDIVGTIPTLDEGFSPATWAIPAFAYPGALILDGSVSTAGKLSAETNRYQSSSARQFYAEPSRQQLRVPQLGYLSNANVPRNFNLPATNARMGAFDPDDMLELPLFYVTNIHTSAPESTWGDRVIWMNPYNPTTGEILPYTTPLGGSVIEAPVIAPVTEALKWIGSKPATTADSITYPLPRIEFSDINAQIQSILTSSALRARILSSGVFDKYPLSDARLLQALLAIK